MIVDREDLDPDGVKASLDFLPYRIQKGVRRAREDFSHFTRLRWEATLRCITIGVRAQPCLRERARRARGRGQRRTYSFKPTRITYEDPNDGQGESAAAGLLAAARRDLAAQPGNAQEIPSYASLGPGGEFGATLAPVDEPSFRAPPWLVGGALLVAALALLALPATLIVREVHRRRPEPQSGEQLSRLESALRRVERMRDHGDAEEQREALEALAFELDGDGRAARVRALAWQSETPACAETSALVAELRGADGASV